MVKRDKQNTLKKDKRPRARNISKKKMIIFIVGGILIAAALVGGLWFYLRGTTSPTQVAERPLTKQETLRNELIDAVVIGDQAQSDDALKEAADAAANDEQRAELYLDRAAYLYYSDDVSDEIKNRALSDAEKSYELHATGAAAKTILDIATSLNRQDLIAKYQPIFDTYIKDIKDLREGEGQ